MGDHLEHCRSCTVSVEHLEQRTDSFITGLQQAYVGCSPNVHDEKIDHVGRLGQGELTIHCPHCHDPINLVEHVPVAEVTCPTCDSTFEVTDDRMNGSPYTHPSRLGNYELLQRVGVGAIGAVWRAKDNTLDRFVAIKIPRLGTHRSTASQQFLREARAAAQLQHPNIVSVHAVEVERDTTYIVSDFVNGSTLAGRIAAKPFGFHEAAELCRKVAVALHHAHEAGVVHRDLKPSNIMIDSEDEPHIMDFGLAKRHAGEITVTVEGRILGTPAYMSPEQAKGNAHTADGRSDIYSLGVMLFELLTGERPFRGATRILLEQVLFEEPPCPRRLDNAIPRDLETICLKCLEKHVDGRYQTAADLSDDLQRFLSGHSVRASRTGSLTRALRWCRRRPFRAALVGVAVMLAIVGPLLAIYERQLRSQADSARWQSEVNERHANAERLTAQARQDTRRFPQRSLLLLLEALTTTAQDGYRVPEAEQTLRDLVGSVGGSPLGGFSRVITSPDSRWLLARDADGFICIWPLSSRAPLNDEPIRFPGRINDLPLVISPDSRWLVHDRPDGCLQIRDLGRNGFPVTKSFDEFVRDAQFSPDSQWLAAGTKAGPILLYQLFADGDIQFARQVQCDAGFFSRNTSFSPDSRWLTTCTRDQITLHPLQPSNHADVHLQRRKGNLSCDAPWGPRRSMLL